MTAALRARLQSTRAAATRYRQTGRTYEADRLDQEARRIEVELDTRSGIDAPAE